MHTWRGVVALALSGRLTFSVRPSAKVKADVWRNLICMMIFLSLCCCAHNTQRKLGDVLFSVSSRHRAFGLWQRLSL
jgi:hypothetical protein